MFFIFTRFYKIADFFNFGVDEEYQALLSWSIVKNFHVLLIGVSASNVGYYLGPGLVYLGAFLLWLSRGNPLSFAYFASFIGVLTIISLYYITKFIFNKKTAIISIILYTFSPLAFYYDRRYWPLAVPLVALWIFFSLIKAFNNSKWLLLTAFLMGISYHLHISLWIFWPIFLFTFFFLLYKKRASLLLIFKSILIFFITTLPLFVFDLVHNYDNLLMPIRLFMFKQTRTPFNLLDRLPYLIQSFTKIWFITNSRFLQNLFFYFFFIFLALIIFKKKSFSINIIGFLVVSFSLAFIFFPSPMQEYYLVLILPFVIIISTLIIQLIPLITYPLLFIFFIYNSLLFLGKPQYGDYKTKMNIIRGIKNKINNDRFILETEGEYITNGGWRYLFQSAGLIPSRSTADSVFGWIYPDEISQIKPKYKVIILKNNAFKILSL